MSSLFVRNQAHDLSPLSFPALGKCFPVLLSFFITHRRGSKSDARRIFQIPGRVPPREGERFPPFRHEEGISPRSRRGATGQPLPRETPFRTADTAPPHDPPR